MSPAPGNPGNLAPGNNPATTAPAVDDTPNVSNGADANSPKASKKRRLSEKRSASKEGLTNAVLSLWLVWSLPHLLRQVSQSMRLLSNESNTLDTQSGVMTSLLPIAVVANQLRNISVLKLIASPLRSQTNLISLTLGFNWLLLALVSLQKNSNEVGCEMPFNLSFLRNQATVFVMIYWLMKNCVGLEATQSHAWPYRSSRQRPSGEQAGLSSIFILMGLICLNGYESITGATTCTAKCDLSCIGINVAIYSPV